MPAVRIFGCFEEYGFKQYNIWFACIFLIMLLSGCGTRSIVSVGGEEITGRQLFEEVEGRNLSIESYSAGRINISVNEKGNIENIRGAVRVKRDSVILISITALAGIEVARISLTHDSIKVIDRINRSYYAGRYDELVNILPYPVDYITLEGLILGTAGHIIERIEFLREDKRVYRIEEGRITVSDINSNKLNNNKSGDDLYKFTFDNIYLLRSIEFFSGDRKEYSRIMFNSFYQSEGTYLPDDIEVLYTTENRSLMVNIKTGRIEINRNFSFPFTVPTGYN